MPTNCQQLHTQTHLSDKRVEQFSTHKPSCACESETLSVHSPGLIQDDELILRVVVSPMHINKKKPNEIKSNFLSHAESKGVSMQRSPIASVGELVNCISTVAKGDDRCWLGYVELSAENIRSIRSEKGAQMYCVADAANQDNPAHAEIHMSSDMPEADRIEFRADLTKMFGKIQNRKALYDGKVWEAMPAHIKDREVPAGFIED